MQLSSGGMGGGGGGAELLAIKFWGFMCMNLLLSIVNWTCQILSLPSANDLVPENIFERN